MQISQFMSNNKPENKTSNEIDSLVEPFSDGIDKLIKSGYSLDQVVTYLKTNGVHLTKSEILFACDRIKKQTLEKKARDE